MSSRVADRTRRHYVRGFGLGSFVIILLVSVTAFLPGCSRMIQIIKSTSDTPGVHTERARRWVREDKGRRDLVVFVHGFVSSIDDAWGDFPTLVKDDPDFASVNILLFGYPTKHCGQVADVARSGELLSSYLKSAASGYDSVILVGHSMGGLVILNGLLTLEQDAPTLFDRTAFIVLTFGTPHAGVPDVPGADLATLLCENKQVSDMSVLNDNLSRLHKRWQTKFGEGTGRARAERLVPLYPYFGHDDQFVPRGSACAGFEKYCEQVDGNHKTMVKPNAKDPKPRDLLAYQKLREHKNRPVVAPTPAGKTGVWVARFRADQKDKEYPAQRETIAQLNTAIRRDQGLKSFVEIRALPYEIRGDPEAEREEYVQTLGERHNASVVIWGEITEVFGGGDEVLRLNVTTIKLRKGTESTDILSPVTRRVRQTELEQVQVVPRDTTKLPPVPARIRGPLQLARFIVALTYFTQGKFREAADHIEELFHQDFSGSHFLTMPDVYTFAGIANLTSYMESREWGSLNRAQDHLSLAVQQYKDLQDWKGQADGQNNLGVTYLLLANTGVEPRRNLNLAEHALESAAGWYEQQKDSAGYARSQLNLGATYQKLAGVGVEPTRNLALAAKALQEATKWYKDQENWVDYATAQMNLGVTYQVWGEIGVAEPVNRNETVGYRV